ncbi:hypothetical protein C0J52_17510 [Blattella germanica]|nr:hypothetical protein C0J52_17510 [Blattella germanica]
MQRGKTKYILKYHNLSNSYTVEEKEERCYVKPVSGGLMPPECFTIRIAEKSIHPAKELWMPTETGYKSKVPINAKKICDLQKIVQYVPHEYSSFYDEIVSWPTTDEDVVLTDAEES